MLSKIATVASLILICTAVPPQPLYSHKQALSSQSFVRHDVPMAYKFTAVHPSAHSTDTTEQKKEVGPIQYAPLYSPNTYPKHDLNPRKYYSPFPENQNKEVKKNHLEPREIEAGAKNSLLSYIPGHNIELKQSVNRSPGLLTEYRSIPESTSEATARSTDKINVHRAFTVYRRPDTQETYSRPPSQEPPKLFTHIVQPAAIAYQNHEKPNTVVNPILEQQLLRTHQRLEDIHDLTKQIESQRVFGYPKMNTLLLNLARVYNARVPLNNHINYLDTIHKVPNNQALYIPSAKITSEHAGGYSISRVPNGQMKLNGH